ncbi:toll/interleukin-1 receptor domain-containing protein [Modestobacter sp. VKM Ac-2978]|uniref:toll/interleukin-1 receptor domain-containing protein n=1 Tax=Modestobacter sp. VKM Ac-2978 TaxID=3004132 RepID=UPI0022AB0213|nr:toll/interleukin-1 receptor domain-containing protein [Modestobacter sp. VKM Ac-2978]MCZ2850198.1 toll/interleukin-1 receptor domain-containing protein [Modestobacter sp. VKM Ac-2978]
MPEKPYDLAVSFAGEQRDYVSVTVEECKALGLKVFYDRDKNNEWWGTSFIREQRNVYSSQAQFFVPFISAEYLNKPIPMDEFSAAMMTAVKQGDGYILPVLMDNARVPADLLHPHIHYLRASDYTPRQLAHEFAAKVGKSRGAGTPPAEIGSVVEHALMLRLPRVAHSDWSKYEELDRIFDYLAEQFTAGVPQLRPKGLVCTTKRQGDRFTVRVERAGETVFALDVSKGGGGLGDDQLTWSVGQRSHSLGGINGWARPEWDRQRDAAVVKVNDLSAYVQRDLNLGSGLTAREFFMYMWDKMIDQIERTSR